MEMNPRLRASLHRAGQKARKHAPKVGIGAGLLAAGYVVFVFVTVRAINQLSVEDRFDRAVRPFGPFARELDAGDDRVDVELVREPSGSDPIMAVADPIAAGRLQHVDGWQRRQSGHRGAEPDREDSGGLAARENAAHLFRMIERTRGG